MEVGKMEKRSETKQQVALSNRAFILALLGAVF